MSKIIISNDKYDLTRAPLFGEGTIEVHFNEYSPKLDFSNGFSIQFGSDEVEPTNYFDYNKKWNVLTELSDGIVLTSEEQYETEDNKLYVFSQEELDAQAEAEAEQLRKDNEELPTIEERIADLETALCELYAELEGGEI